MRTPKSCSGAEHFRRRTADTHIRDIHNRMPVTAELADLLGINFKQNVCAMF